MGRELTDVARRARPRARGRIVGAVQQSHCRSRRCRSRGALGYAFDGGRRADRVRRDRDRRHVRHLRRRRRAGGGERSRMPFHVTSANWQESDRFLAGLDDGVRLADACAAEMDGAGEFDGVLTGAFRRPRIEGHFRGRAMRAFDVTWGDAEGDVVIENCYANVSDATHHPRRLATRRRRAVLARLPASRSAARRSTRASGSTGGRSPICSTPSTSRTIRSTGTLSGDFHLYGPYTRPFGFGRMTIDDGTAYGEPFDDRVGRAALRRQRRAPRRDRRSPRATARSPAPPTSAGTAPTRSTPRAATLAVETLDSRDVPGPAAADRRARVLRRRQRAPLPSRATTSRSTSTICSSARKASARSPAGCRCATSC